MKKSLLLSAAAAATMLFSCSSEETASVPSIDKSDLTPVVLSLAKNSTEVYQTRGTGTVGDTAKANNLYHNEDLYVLMTTVPTEGSEWKYTTVDAKDKPTAGLGEQFNNSFKSRPTKPDENGFWGIDYLKYSGMKRYYPIDGTRSDFFVYHIDDAAVDSTKAKTDDEPGDPAGPDGTFNPGPKVVNGTTPETKVVKFQINGSQDLLAGKAHKVLSDEQISTLGEQEVNKRGFNAKTARAGVVPQITMKHLLTRFTFSVQSGHANAKDLKINAIKVYSKATGNLIVAYNNAETLPVSDLIEWDDADPVALALMQRPGANNDNIVDEKGEKTKLVAFTPVTMTEDTETRVNIGEAMFVKPNETEYSIVIEYEFPYGENQTYEVIDVNQKIQNGGAPFDPGTSYHVNIKVYGMSEIVLETELEAWKNYGDPLEIDTDELYQQ